MLSAADPRPSQQRLVQTMDAKVPVLPKESPGLSSTGLPFLLSKHARGYQSGVLRWHVQLTPTPGVYSAPNWMLLDQDLRIISVL